jgi:hypothetical protein
MNFTDFFMPKKLKLMYFNNCHTADQCKAQYRELAKRLHPDTQGGSAAAFQKMQQEYEGRLRELLAQQEAGYGNPADFQNLIIALLEVVKITRPKEYELVKIFAKNEKVSAVTQLLNAFFPEKANTVNKILNLLQ